MEFGEPRLHRADQLGNLSRQRLDGVRVVLHLDGVTLTEEGHNGVGGKKEGGVRIQEQVQTSQTYSIVEAG